MAVPVYQSSSSAIGYGSGTTVTPGSPSGTHAADDVYILVAVAACTSDDVGNDFTLSANGTGWTRFGVAMDPNWADRVEFWWYRRGSSTPTMPTVNMAATSPFDCYAVVHRFSGCVTTGDPWEAFTGTNANGRTSPAIVPDCTTTGADRLVCNVYEYEGTSSATTPPSGWTERSELNTTSGFDCRLILDTLDQATATTVTGGTRSFNGDAWATASFALVPPTAGGINGTLGVTIDAVTQSTTGNLLIQGSAAQTISAVTQSAAGKVLVQGSLAATLDAVTLAASGGSSVTATFAQTIDAVTLSASAKVLVQGSLASTIAPVTQVASGKVIIAGSLAQTIDPVTQAAQGSGSAVGSGALNSTLDPVTLVASGDVIISGALSATIAPVTQSSAGALVIKGSFGKTIDPVTLAASGSADLPAIAGTFGQVIDAVTLFATATISQPVLPRLPDTGGSGNASQRRRRNINDDADAFAELLKEWRERKEQADEPEAQPTRPAARPTVRHTPAPTPEEPDDTPELLARVVALEAALDRTLAAYDAAVKRQAVAEREAQIRHQAIVAAEELELARLAYEAFLDDEDDIIALLAA